MDNGNPVAPGHKPRNDKTQTKKPYRKPAFRFERVFETQALSCGKVRSTIGQCKSNRKNS